MGRAARAEYEAKYTADRDCKMLMGLYQNVLGERRANNGKTSWQTNRN